MSIERVVVLHGYTASPRDHWFGWLREELGAGGVDVVIPALPNSARPEPAAWIAAATEAIGEPDEHTALVTHSLGGITGLRALDQLDGPWRLGALVSVAGFVSTIAPALAPFTSTVPDLARLATRIDRRVVIRSDNDSIVDPAVTSEFTALFDAEAIVVPGAGHFLGREGVTTLPAVADVLRSL